jgi:arylsulfatase A-like enzyme
MNRFLPTVHGFDEFYGNLYHLNAEEDPEHDRVRDHLQRDRQPSRLAAHLPGRGR